MSEQRIIRIMSGKARGPGATLARAGLSVLSCPYAAAMGLRRRAYRRGLLQSYAGGVPVVCVGNITTGGTGKTPMVAWVVAKLKELGKRPAILTRGYKAHAGRSDEAEMLRELCRVEVVVNPDRVAGTADAANGGADVVVMDDGYQHMRLKRDLDIVLVDAMNPLGYGWCLPRGLLREPAAALADAGAVVITRSDCITPDDLRSLRRKIADIAPGAEICIATHKPVKLVDGDGDRRLLAALAGQKAYAFCGLGNPDAFFATAENLDISLVGSRVFDDHARYDAGTCRRICDAAVDAGADVLLTTAKDMVKLEREHFSLPVWQVVVEMELTEGTESLLAQLRRVSVAS